MSPSGEIGVLEACVAVVERDTAIEGVADLDLGAGKTKATRLGMNLQAPAIPLHDVVVADNAFVSEAANALQILWRRAPRFFVLARVAGEAAIIVGDEAAQHGIGGNDVTSFGQAEFAGETILEHPPEAFDAAFGLGRLRGDKSNAELMEGAAELSGLALAGELLVERPVVVIASEDATAIAIEGEREAIAAQEILKQVEIALSGF